MPIVKLRCRDCSSFSCKICPIGTYVPEDYLCGCSRKLSDEEYAEYIHIKEELAPFLKKSQYKKYFEQCDYLDELLLSKPIAHILDRKGKVVVDSSRGKRKNKR